MESSGTSKSAKKNAKKREKKRLEKKCEEKTQLQENLPLKDPVAALKEHLAEAKSMGDHTLAAKLRQDLWVLQDLSSGHEPIELDKKEVDESLQHILLKPSSENTSQNTSQSSSDDTSIDKDLKKLKKKLTQIEKLKKMKERGEKLEATQVVKIESENDLLQEIREMEEMINSVKITR